MDFVLQTLGFIFVIGGILIIIPFHIYGIYKHIKKYGIHERIKGNHMFKGEKPIPILLFELTILIGGSYFMFIGGNLYYYIDNVIRFFNN